MFDATAVIHTSEGRSGAGDIDGVGRVLNLRLHVVDGAGRRVVNLRLHVVDGVGRRVVNLRLHVVDGAGQRVVNLRLHVVDGVRLDVVMGQSVRPHANVQRKRGSIGLEMRKLRTQKLTKLTLDSEDRRWRRRPCRSAMGRTR